MAIVTTPLGFQKPDGLDPVKNGDNVIAANADKAEQRITEDRGRLGAIEAKNTAQDATLTTHGTRLTAAESAATTLTGRVAAAENKNTAQDTDIATARTNAVADAKTYTDAKTLASVTTPVLLVGTENLLTLPNGRYRVSSGSAADALGLPTSTASHGFLEVKRNPTTARLTWEAISITDPSEWTRQQASGAWSSAWDRVDGRKALADAKAYADAQDEAYRATDRSLWRSEDDSHQAAAEANAATYTDGKDTTNRADWAAADATKLAEAKAYADTQDADYRTTDRALWRSEDDAHQIAAEAAAKTYTDGQVATDRGRLTAIEGVNTAQDGRLDTVEGMQPVKAVKLETGKWVWGLAGATHFVIPDHTGALIVRATAQPVPTTTPALNW